MRTLGSALLGLVAVLLAVTAFCSAWLAENVVSDAGFPSLGQPLATDAAVQQDLAEALGRQAVDSVQMPDAVVPLVEPLITGAVQGVQSLPEYPQAWNETLQRSHAQTFDGGGDITLDVAPLVALVTGGVGAQTGIDVAPPEQSPITLAADQGRNLDLLVSAAGAWPYLALGAAAAAVLSLLAARSRSSALAWLGAGALLAGALIWFAAGSLPALAARPAYGSAAAETFAAAFASETAASVQAWTLPCLLGAAVLVVLGLVARSVSGTRRRRAAYGRRP